MAWKNAELYKGFSEKERRRTKTKKVVGRCEIYIYIYSRRDQREREREGGRHDSGFRSLAVASGLTFASDKNQAHE